MSEILMLKILTIINVVIVLVYCHNNGLESPPTMTKQPQYEQLFQVSQSSDEADLPFMIECEAKGIPEPTYRWFKNGLAFTYMTNDKRINQKPNRGTLVFTKPEYVDEGVYQCFADNDYGTSVSNTVLLRAAELGSFPDEEVIELYATEGDPFTIECNPPSGYPKPSIFWIILSNSGWLRSINSSRITVDPEGKLHFSNVTRMDQLDGLMYACSTTSVFRKEYKIGRRTALIVALLDTSEQSSLQPIVQYVSPHSVLVLRGQRLELHCIFGGTPLPDIVWNKTIGSLSGSPFNYSNYGKTLIINNVDYHDSGTYECTASNGIGSQKSHSMEVTVESKPFWVKYPNNTYKAEGERVKFECIANGTPDPKLEWFVNGIPIESAPYNNRRKIDENVMTIENLIETVDTAVYQCKASNIHGYVFRDFYINVQNFPPNITEPPDNVTRAVITKTVTLKCRVFGAPNHVVKWFHDSIELKSGRFKVLENGDLVIKNVKFTDYGQYTCKAFNKFGEASVYGELLVMGKTNIRFATEDIEVVVGNKAIFKCNAEADPSLSLKVEWLFNQNPIDFDYDPRIVQLIDNSLIITRTKESDSGRYTCVAKTELDQITANTTLTVLDVANPPQIINIDCQNFSAIVEWQSIDVPRAPILKYKIQQNTSFSPDIWKDSIEDIPATNNKIKLSLSPWTNYTFRVIAINVIGLSEPSVPSNVCTTEEDVPHKNPDYVMGRGTSPNNLVINWTPMPPIEQNAPNFFYKVFWKRNDIPNSEWETKNISYWQENSLTIDNQPTFKSYRIKVEAHNSRGISQTKAIEVLGYSGEDKPLQTPQHFRLEEVRDAKSAIFSWEGVKTESVMGYFRGYKIQTWVEGEDEKHMREVIVPPFLTGSLVQVFRPFSRNYVRILAFNDFYNGDPSPSVIFYTPEGTPGRLASLKIVSKETNTLFLYWSPPVEPNGVLNGYRIFYEEINGTKLGPKLERQPQIFDAEIIGTKLSNLKPLTKYRITMYATTNIGMGEPIFVEEETLSEDQTQYPTHNKICL